MIFSSPAKINKGFNVIKKRSDGFHDIETNFQFLEWGDEIEFNFGTNIAQVSCPGIKEENNLAYKALNLLKKKLPFQSKQILSTILLKHIVFF